MKFEIGNNRPIKSYQLMIRLDHDLFDKFTILYEKNHITKQNLIIQMMEHCIKEMEQENG